MPQCVPEGLPASSEGCCRVPTHRLIIRFCIQTFEFVWPFFLEFPVAQFLCAGNRSLHFWGGFRSISRRVALWHVLPLLITLSLWRLPASGARQWGHPCIFSRAPKHPVQRDHVEAMQGFLRGSCRHRCLAYNWRGDGVYRLTSCRRCLHPSLQVRCQFGLGACNHALSLFSHWHAKSGMPVKS